MIRRFSFLCRLTFVVPLAFSTLLCAPSVAHAAAYEAGQVFPVSTAVGTQSSPSIDGDIVVWGDLRSGTWDVFGYDLSTETEFVVSDASGEQMTPIVSGDFVVWTDWRNYASTQSDIYGYSLASGTEFPVSTNPANQVVPWVSDGVAVWSDDRAGDANDSKYDVYGRALPGGSEFPVSTATAWQVPARISGSIVVWVDTRNDLGDIYGYDLATQIEFPVCVAPGVQSRPDVSGDIVVWEDSRNDPLGVNIDIYGFDLSTSTEFRISDSPGSETAARISGDLVVWVDNRNGLGTTDLYGYDLATGTEFPIYTGPGVQEQPDISGQTVVWSEWTTPGQSDIYGVRLEAASDSTAPALVVSAAGTAGNAGWYRSDVMVTVTATDDGSGVANMGCLLDGEPLVPSPVLSPEGGGPTASIVVPVTGDAIHTLVLWAVDVSGNRSDDVAADIWIDTTPPDIAIASPFAAAVYLQGQPVVADWTATDVTSGVDWGHSDATPVETSVLGAHTFTVAAEDLAGNVATESVIYTVGLQSAGLVQPSSGGGSPTANAGSTSPLRFTLSDAAGQLISGLTPHLFLARLSDGVWSSEIEAVAQGASNQGNAFRETAPGTYLFNLSTNGLAPGTWRLRVDLGNGGVIVGQVVVS